MSLSSNSTSMKFQIRNMITVRLNQITIDTGASFSTRHDYLLEKYVVVHCNIPKSILDEICYSDEKIDELELSTNNLIIGNNNNLSYDVK